MTIIEVTTPSQENQFFEMTSYVYREDSNYISPIRGDIDDVFSKKNKA